MAVRAMDGALEYGRFVQGTYGLRTNESLTGSRHLGAALHSGGRGPDHVPFSLTRHGLAKLSAKSSLWPRMLSVSDHACTLSSRATC
jgi:hypothetical protein